MKEDFIIPLNGLKSGKTSFSWKADVEFFRQFENNDIKDADIAVSVLVEKSGTYLGIDAELAGFLTVACDRCGDDVSLPVSSLARMSVKFGAEPVGDEEIAVTDERETVYLPDDGADMDMSQIIYDYACLALPMQRIHKDGECNPEALKYLNDGPVQESDEAEGNSPFAVLKGMFDEGRSTGKKQNN